jgi:hypothetical protein
MTHLRQLLLCFLPLIQQPCKASAAANRLLQAPTSSTETLSVDHQFILQETEQHMTTAHAHKESCYIHRLATVRS